MDLKKLIKNHIDYPLAGIVFRDIVPLLNDSKAFSYVIDQMAEQCKDADVIIAPEARGFVFGAPIAYKLKKPFIMARKSGKLPGEVINKQYNLEYTTGAIIELQKDNIRPGQKAVFVDDLLATGKTAKAVKELVELQGGKVIKCVYLIELKQYSAKENSEIEVASLIEY
ncbi:MAG: adenine phosphoribosyltransferase [Mycoplasma sp.]|nr:adenine phosphoribosyltransferase [Mycoplasma sp.]